MSSIHWESRPSKRQKTVHSPVLGDDDLNGNALYLNDVGQSLEG